MTLPTSLARFLLGESQHRHLSQLSVRDAGFGHDELGLNADAVRTGAAVLAPMYRHYFRVVAHGAEHIPKEGAAILAANHSGTLPFDGALIYLDVLARAKPPRVVRPIGDLFIPRLPFVSTLFSRLGVAAGTRGNVRHLLEAGELLLIFPEGTPGIGKPYSERYRLRRFRGGHAEFAIRHRVPIIPVGVVGAEEAMAQLTRIDGLHPFGAPYLPVPATPFPLPTRIHIHYGEALNLYEGLPPDAADEPKVVTQAAARVQAAVQRLLDEGLLSREGIFR